jgi:hypothetical protein
MHLCIAASLALCWACWAVACDTNAAAETANANAKKSLFALLIDPSSVVETFVSPGPAIILILFAPDQLSAAYYFSAALAYETTAVVISYDKPVAYTNMTAHVDHCWIVAQL